MDFTEMDFILMNSIETPGDLGGYKRVTIQWNKSCLQVSHLKAKQKEEIMAAAKEG